MQRTELLTRLRSTLLRIDPTISQDLTDACRFQDCNLDSLDLVEFIARLEQEFALQITDSDFAKLVSLEATADYLTGRLAA